MKKSLEKKYYCSFSPSFPRPVPQGNKKERKKERCWGVSGPFALRQKNPSVLCVKQARKEMNSIQNPLS